MCHYIQLKRNEQANFLPKRGHESKVILVMKPKGKVALITGSAVRLGKAIALALAEQGIHIILQYRTSEKEARVAAAQIRRKRVHAHPLQCDLSNSREVERLAGQALALFGRVDILVNNASEFFRTPIASITEEEWDRFLDVNLKAPFLLSRSLGRKMVKQGAGKVINIADVSVSRPGGDFIPYSVSKAGLVTLTQGLAKALAPRVQVNAIAPGTILPPVTGWTSRQRERILRSIPLKRFGVPDDITRAVLFLIESDYITGIVIPVDGGKSIV